jgi:phage N-6-adenine-methyltransferase
MTENYLPHPISELLPLMSGNEFCELKEDIKSRGLLVPVLMYEDRILDGRNRFKACQEVGVTVRTVEYDGDNPLADVVSMNLKRRHLTESQRGMIAAKLANMPPHRPDINTANLRTSQQEAAKLLNISERTVNTAKKVEQNAIPELVEKVNQGDISVSAAAIVSNFGETEQKEIIAEINEGEKPFEVIKKHVHVAQNSGENEWYTPSEFIESARLVMGSIDLDPASSDLANKTVKAAVFYSKEDNGLDKSWSGNVWLNPPYAQPLMNQFADKLLNERVNIKQAIVLINNATETKWFQSIAKEASTICFPSSRIKFIDKAGNPTGQPLQGQAILYFGDDGGAFNYYFSNFGLVLRR